MLGTIIFFIVGFALIGPSVIWGIKCLDDKTLYKPSKGQFASIMLWVVFIIGIITLGIWQVFAFLTVAALVMWIGLKLLLKFIGFLWK